MRKKLFTFNTEGCDKSDWINYYAKAVSHYDTSELSKLENISTNIHDLISQTEILLPSELDTIDKLLKKALERLESGIIGESDILHSERNETINKIITK